MVLNCSNIGSTTHSLNHVQHFHQWNWSQIQESNSQARCVFSHSYQWFQFLTAEQLTPWTYVHSCHPDLQQLKHWGWTHKLDHVQPFLSVVLICSKAGEPLTSCVLGVLVSSSDLLKHWRVTHLLNHVHCSPSVVLICSNTGEQLTSYMCFYFSLLIKSVTASSSLTVLFFTKSIRFQLICIKEWMSHTYCQYSISQIFIANYKILLISHSKPHVNHRWYKSRSKLVSHGPYSLQLLQTLFWNINQWNFSRMARTYKNMYQYSLVAIP